MIMMKLKEFLKQLVPPLLTDAYRRLRYGARKPEYGYFGDYRDWKAALADSSGYDSAAVFDKVFAALSLVRDKKAVYERDSVLFDRIHYAWPLLSGLMWIAALKGSRLNVVDYGGSLGSTYFQNEAFLKGLACVRWSVIEQPRFVECGKKHFEDGRLKFYGDLRSCVEAERPDAIILSSVIEYLPDPYGLIGEIIKDGFEFVIIDRTIFFDEPDRITVQKVPPYIYDASYPCRIFNRKKFLGVFAPHYDLVADFEALGGKTSIGGTPAAHEGFIFRRRPEKPAAGGEDEKA